MSAALLCLTCSSTLSSIPSHSNSEKPEPAPLLLPCGLHTVCGRCQTHRRRLAQSCILCESASSVLAPKRGTASAVAATSRRGGPPARVAAATSALPPYEAAGDSGGFVIGDSDDEEAGEVGEKRDLLDGPPAYDDAETPPTTANANEKGGGGVDGTERQVQMHYLMPEDTMLGLSMRYGEPGEVLCRLNKLPISTLSTTPHLLHTRSFLLLPPSASSTSTTPLHAPLEERRRLILRRFQVRTRCSDWAMASAYVGQVFRERDQELEMVRANRIARGADEAGLAGLKVREGDELEEAVEAYEKDQKWEEGQKGKGKLGSKMRSTGLVEREVKGWSWR